MPVRLGRANHVNLTVSDLARSTEWYCRVLGLTVVSNHENVGPPYFNDNAYNGLFDLTTMSYVVGLIQHRDPVAGPFDERRVGLDHFALAVPERADLDDWVTRLDELGVPHSGVVEAPYAHAVNLRDPDGIALELYVLVMDFWTDLVTRTLSG